MSKNAKGVLDKFFEGLIGPEQKRAAERVRDGYAADEETAGMFNRMLDELEEKLSDGSKGNDGTPK